MQVPGSPRRSGWTNIRAVNEWAGRHARALLAGLVVVHATLLTWSAARNSVTIDEYAHVAAGAAYVRYGGWFIYNQSPPLLRLPAGAGALLAGADAPPAKPFLDDPSRSRYWNYADAFTRLNRERYHTVLVSARLPMILLSSAGLVLVFHISRALHGPAGAVASGALYCFCPNLAAHGSIVGTDSGTAILMLAAVWGWIGACRSATPARALAAGALLGAALLSKFNAVLLIPVWAAVAVWGIAIEPGRWRNIVTAAGIAGLIALLLLNTCYGFRGSFRTVRSYAFESQSMQDIRAALPPWLPVPLPQEFVLGFDAAKWEIEQPFPAFLLGEEYRGTRMPYYPVAMFCKTPLSVLLLLALTAGTMLRRRTRLQAADAELPLLVALVMLLIGIAATATVNIGVRYLLPIYPMTYVLMGRLWRADAAASAEAAGWSRAGSIAVWLAVLGLMIESTWIAPRYISFFNAAVGGTRGGQAVVNDSNADWGQALIDLRDWMKSCGVERVQLAYFGRIDPGAYGIAYTPANQVGGERYIAVSTYFRQGLTYRTPTPDGMSGWIRLPNAELLRKIEPVAVVGNVIYVYDRQDVVRAMRSQ